MAASPADVLTPIPGTRIDKEPKPKPDKVAELEREQRWGAVLWETWMRFKTARAPLMAAGTSYYGFIAMFSLLAFAYGIAALLDADAIADWLTRSLEEALPGLVGEQGIAPETLASIGAQRYPNTSVLVVDGNGNPVQGVSVLVNIEKGPNGGEYIDDDATPGPEQPPYELALRREDAEVLGDDDGHVM